MDYSNMYSAAVIRFMFSETTNFFFFFFKSAVLAQ